MGTFFSRYLHPNQLKFIVMDANKKTESQKIMYARRKAESQAQDREERILARLENTKKFLRAIKLSDEIHSGKPVDLEHCLKLEEFDKLVEELPIEYQEEVKIHDFNNLCAILDSQE